ncbi:hypothetical protein KVR01_005556 [Diaporthe batatas]|uniref:uncharacterized protein n=1 Tax=Diaporthe batatas TaxID=748121 RepID=UPI001D0596C3|nr:uncharacterized protein KVR01_005556 [Diaporthe batatas]KAG8165281.1 hypothetical protein KVR01_005556 [Diaporthe batatas]
MRTAIASEHDMDVVPWDANSIFSLFLGFLVPILTFLLLFYGCDSIFNRLQARDNEAPAQTEHLNIKVTDNNNEVFFKIKKSTKLEKLMGAFCERQGKTVNSVRFLFEGQRVQPNDTPDTLEMQDGDTLEVHQEQVGGSGLL